MKGPLLHVKPALPAIVHMHVPALPAIVHMHVPHQLLFLFVTLYDFLLRNDVTCPHHVGHPTSPILGGAHSCLVRVQCGFRVLGVSSCTKNSLKARFLTELPRPGMLLTISPRACGSSGLGASF